MSLFKVRGPLTQIQSLVLGIIGVGLVLLLWTVLTMGAEPIASAGILPSPGSVFKAFGDMYEDNELLRNLSKSLSINIAGYIEAIVISIILGFIIGLVPLFRGLFQRQVDALSLIHI